MASLLVRGPAEAHFFHLPTRTSEESQPSGWFLECFRKFVSDRFGGASHFIGDSPLHPVKISDGCDLRAAAERGMTIYVGCEALVTVRVHVCWMINLGERDLSDESDYETADETDQLARVSVEPGALPKLLGAIDGKLLPRNECKTRHLFADGCRLEDDDALFFALRSGSTLVARAFPQKETRR